MRESEMELLSRSTLPNEQTSSKIENSKVDPQLFPSLKESYGVNEAVLLNLGNGVDSPLGVVGDEGGRNMSNPEESIPAVADFDRVLDNPCPSQIDGFMGKGLSTNPNPKDWRALFQAPRPISKHATMKFTSPTEVNGKLVVAAKTENFSKEMKRCENRVVGFFVGKRLSFSAVQAAVGKLWKFRKEVRIKLYDNCAFIFEFDDDEDRKLVLDTRSFYISKHLFALRPWSLLLEKSVSENNSVPIWVLIYGIPLHMWDNEGLGLISSFLGKPLLADNCTINQDRLAFARICVEIDANFSYPEKIPLLIDENFTMDLPVEYLWRPPRCEACKSFGHTSKICLKNSRKRWLPKKTITPNGEGMRDDQVIIENGDNNIINVGGLDPREVRDSSVEINAEVSTVARSEIATTIIGLKNDASSSVENEVSTVARSENAVSIQPDSVKESLGAAHMGDRDPATIEMQASKEGVGVIVGRAVTEVISVLAGSSVAVPAGSSVKNSEVVRNTESSLEGARLVGQSIESTVLAEQEGEWTKVKTRSKAPSPKKNPFIMKNDFPYLSKSRFPVDSRKHTQAELVSPSKGRQLEEAKLKKLDKELARLQWEGSPISVRGGTGDSGRGCRSQKK